MKFILSFLLVVFSYTSFAQLTLSSTSSCTSYTLTASLVGLTPSSTNISTDDRWSQVVPLGFTFNFYGTPYTDCIIGDNGLVSFDLGNANSACTYMINGSLATSAAPAGSDLRNVIAGPWCDILITAGGTIRYATVGTAPNRRFVVTFCGTHMFSCTAQWTTSQIIIYEGTNIVEVHITHKTSCGWNSGRAICGVANANGSATTTAPGRDWNPNWTVTNDAWQFTPNATATAYTVAPITYAPIPYATSGIYWYDSATHAYLGTGTSIVVSPNTTTTYMAAVLSCADSVKSFITVAGLGAVIGVPHISNITATDPSLCGLCDGTIKLYGITPNQVDTVFATINGIPQAPFVSTTGSDSIMTFTGLCPGAYSYYVKVGICPSNTVTATITTPPPIPASFSYTTRLGCNGDTIMLINTTTPSIYHSYWNFGDGSAVDSTNVNPVHIFNDVPTNYIDTYTVTLNYNTSYDPACQTTYTVSVPFNHPIDAFITASDTSVCWLTGIDFTASTTSTHNPSYQWDLGNESPIQTTKQIDSFKYLLPNDYTVKLTVTDSIGCSSVDLIDVHVISINTHMLTHDTSVCLNDSMSMRAYVTIQPDRYSYTGAWTPANNIGINTYAGTGDNMVTTKFFGIGEYIYVFADTLSVYPYCNSSDTEAIHSFPPITLTHLTASQTIPWGNSIQLNAQGALYYTWRPNNGTLDNPNINNPVAVPIDSVTIYTVYGMSTYGCLDSASITISLDKMTEFVPSAFTPNGDGLNDLFRITNMTFQKLIDFRVYNRWGQLVFETADRAKGWDGTLNGVPQDMGVYSYHITIGLIDGGVKTYKGTVTLIR